MSAVSSELSQKIAESVRPSSKGPVDWGILLKLLPTVFMLGFVPFVIGVVAMKESANSKEQEAAAKMFAQAWPQNAGALSISTKKCVSGPARECSITATVGGESIEVWPEINWAQGWLPFKQWKVARQIALDAPQSARGVALSESSPGYASELGPRANAAPGASEKDIAEPKIEQGHNWQAALFSDGMTIPLTQNSDGEWFILAQGPATQAARMLATKTGRPDPGVVPALAQAEKAWEGREAEAAKESAPNIREKIDSVQDRPSVETRVFLAPASETTTGAANKDTLRSSLKKRLADRMAGQ